MCKSRLPKMIPCLRTSFHSIANGPLRSSQPRRSVAHLLMCAQMGLSGADSQAAAGLAHARPALPVHGLLRRQPARLPRHAAPVFRLPPGPGHLGALQHPVPHGGWAHGCPSHCGKPLLHAIDLWVARPVMSCHAVHKGSLCVLRSPRASRAPPIPSSSWGTGSWSLLS